MKSVAIVYCSTCLDSTRGKTAHGLIRYTERYDVRAVIDTVYAGQDAGMFLDGKSNGIPIVPSLEAALTLVHPGEQPAFVMGLATDGGVLPGHAREAVRQAIGRGMDVVSGLHVFLSEDPELSELARVHGANLVDVRKPPHRSELHFYSGRMGEVQSVRVLVLGTDSASGKRTTSWALRNALLGEGYRAEMIGTGQTAWMQGARYGIRLDSLVNDFVAGEIEHALLTAWETEKPEVMVIEGQGALLHPAYPGGLELIAAVQPDVILLQHVPARQTFDGFENLPMPDMHRQIAAVEKLADRPVDALTINPKGLSADEAAQACAQLESAHGIPAVDVFREGCGRLVSIVESRLRSGSRPA